MRAKDDLNDEEEVRSRLLLLMSSLYPNNTNNLHKLREDEPILKLLELTDPTYTTNSLKRSCQKAILYELCTNLTYVCSAAKYMCQYKDKLSNKITLILCRNIEAFKAIAFVDTLFRLLVETRFVAWREERELTGPLARTSFDAEMLAARALLRIVGLKRACEDILVTTCQKLFSFAQIEPSGAKRPKQINLIIHGKRLMRWIKKAVQYYFCYGSKSELFNSLTSEKQLKNMLNEIKELRRSQGVDKINKNLSSSETTNKLFLMNEDISDRETKCIIKPSKTCCSYDAKYEQSEKINSRVGYDLYFSLRSSIEDNFNQPYMNSDSIYYSNLLNNRYSPSKKLEYKNISEKIICSHRHEFRDKNSTLSEIGLSNSTNIEEGSYIILSNMNEKSDCDEYSLTSVSINRDNLGKYSIKEFCRYFKLWPSSTKDLFIDYIKESLNGLSPKLVESVFSFSSKEYMKIKTQPKRICPKQYNEILINCYMHSILSKDFISQLAEISKNNLRNIYSVLTVISEVNIFTHGDRERQQTNLS